MDNKKPKQFTVTTKSFKDEDKQSSDQFQFHHQSPRFVNSKNQSPQQSPYKDETQNSPIQSPRFDQQRKKTNSQILLDSGGKSTISRAPAIDSSNNLNDFNLFDYKGEKDFYVKMSSKLNEIASNGDYQVAKFLEKVYKTVLEEDYSLSQLQRTISRSKNDWKDLLKIKNQSSCQSLIANILPHFSRALQRRSLSNIQDLLKITLLYSYEQYNGIEKSLNSILDLFTKMLQIPQKSEEEDTISNHVQRLVLLNIQSFCTPSISSKFQTEFQLIFKRIYELIMHFFNLSNNQQPFQSQQSASSACTSSSSISNESSGKYYSFLRFLATLLRTGNMVIAELKDNKTFSADANNQKLTEKVFLRIFKYIFLGNSTFHLSIFGTNQKGMLYRQNHAVQSSDYLISSNNSSRSNLTSNSQMNNSFSASSQSEWSENDDILGGNDRNKVEMIECKIRNYTCLLIQTIIRQFPSILKSQWQTLIKSKNMTKDFLHLLKSNSSLEERRIPQTKPKNDSKKIEEEHEQDEKDEQKVQEKADDHNIRDYPILYPNYMETSLLSSLVFEENNKIKGNILSTLSVLIENLPSKQLLFGLDVEKFEKQTPSFKPQSYLIYQSYKNIHFTLIHMLQTLFVKKLSPNNSYQNIILQSPNSNHDSQNQSTSPLDWFINEQDEEILSLCNQILKVYISFFNSTIQLEKMPFKDGIDLLLRQFLLKILRHVKTTDASLEALHLKFNAYQILNCIAKCNMRFDQFANYYLLADFKNNNDNQFEHQNKEYQYNLYDLCMADIKLKTHITDNNQGSEQSQCLHDVSILQKEDALRELISIESINLLINLQKNYFDRTLITSQNNFLIWEKIQEFIQYFEEERTKTSIDKKRLHLLYELIIMIAERRNIALSFVEQLFKKKNKEKILQEQNSQRDNKNEQQNINEDENQNEDVQEDLEDDDEDNQNQSDQNKLSFQTAIAQKPELIDTLLKFENEIFSKYIIEKLNQFIQQSFQNENNKSQIHDEIDIAPIIICCLNLSVQIRNEQWIQNPDTFNFFKDKLFSLNINPVLRFHYFKTLGCIISCSAFNQDPQNCRQILEILLKEKHQIGVKKTAANLSVFSKLSQSLANWCYNVQDYSVLSTQTLQSLLAAIIDLASSPKDKISPHGLRALGIFLMKIQSQLYTRICNPAKEDEVLCNLLCDNLTHKSSKVVWNACVAIQNIFTNLNYNLDNKQQHQNQLNFFFSPKSISQLTHSLEDVLLSINNQKSQLYSLRALKSIMNHPSSTLQVSIQSENKNNQNESEILRERIPHLLNVLTDIGSDIYSFQNAHNFGESVVKFLIQMIQRVYSLNNSNEILIDFIKDKYYQIISSFSQYIYQLWKSSKLDHHQSFLKEQSFQDSEKDIFNIKGKDLSQMEVLIKPEQQIQEQINQPQQEQISEQKQQEIYEELLVKGQDEFKCVIFDFKFIKKSKDLREQLKLLKQSSLILQQVIDQNDDLSVSLTIYDHIKEYASINVDSPILKFSLH